MGSTRPMAGTYRPHRKAIKILGWYFGVNAFWFRVLSRFLNENRYFEREAPLYQKEEQKEEIRTKKSERRNAPAVSTIFTRYRGKPAKHLVQYRGPPRQSLRGRFHSGWKDRRPTSGPTPCERRQAVCAHCMSRAVCITKGGQAAPERLPAPGCTT